MCTCFAGLVVEARASITGPQPPGQKRILICVHVCWRQRQLCGVFLDLIFLRQGLSVNLEITNSAILVGQKVLGNGLPPSLSSSEIAAMRFYPWFYVGSGPKSGSHTCTVVSTYSVFHLWGLRSQLFSTSQIILSAACLRVIFRCNKTRRLTPPITGHTSMVSRGAFAKPCAYSSSNVVRGRWVCSGWEQVMSR